MGVRARQNRFGTLMHVHETVVFLLAFGHVRPLGGLAVLRGSGVVEVEQRAGVGGLHMVGLGLAAECGAGLGRPLGFGLILILGLRCLISNTMILIVMTVTAGHVHVDVVCGLMGCGTRVETDEIHLECDRVVGEGVVELRELLLVVGPFRPFRGFELVVRLALLALAPLGVQLVVGDVQLVRQIGRMHVLNVPLTLVYVLFRLYCCA